MRRGDEACVDAAREGGGDGREASARRFHRGAGDTDEPVIEAPRGVEAANAQALAASVERAHAPRAAHERIAAAPPLPRPVTALLDLVQDPRGEKRAVLATALDTHAPQVALSAAATTYGLAGLISGSFVSESLVSAAGRLASARRDRARPLAR